MARGASGFIPSSKRGTASLAAHVSQISSPPGCRADATDSASLEGLRRLLSDTGAPEVVDRRDKTGIAAGTPVLTQDGALPVEHVMAGDRIITRDRGMVELCAVQSRILFCDPVRLSQAALGRACPVADAILPPDQSILIRGARARSLFGMSEVCVPACHLVNGADITQWRGVGMRVFDLMFDASHVIYAGGLELRVSTS